MSSIRHAPNRNRSGPRPNHLVGENEAVAIAAFHFCEDFAGESFEGGASGYLRRFKMADRLKGSNCT